MKIRVKFRHRKPAQSPLVIANCDINIDNNIVVGGVRFLYNPSVDLYTLQMPARRTPDGDYYPIVEFNNDTKNFITDEVTKQYLFLKARGLWKAS